MSDTTALRLIVVRDVPVGPFLGFQEHLDSLVREFQLMVIGAESETTRPVPAQILPVVQRILEQYSGPRLHLRLQAQEALRRGDETVDLWVELPPEAADAARELQELMELADDYCASGALLSLATPEDQAQVRQWFLERVIEELESPERD